MAYGVDAVILMLFAGIKVLLLPKLPWWKKIAHSIFTWVGLSLLLFAPLTFILYVVSGVPSEESTLEKILAGTAASGMDRTIYLLAALFLTSHTLSFFLNYVSRQEKKEKTVSSIIGNASIRPTGLYVIWIASMLLGITNESAMRTVFFFGAFIVKLAFDIAGHIQEHRLPPLPRSKNAATGKDPRQSPENRS